MSFSRKCLRSQTELRETGMSRVGNVTNTKLIWRRYVVSLQCSNHNLFNCSSVKASTFHINNVEFDKADSDSDSAD